MSFQNILACTKKVINLYDCQLSCDHPVHVPETSNSSVGRSMHVITDKKAKQGEFDV